MKKISPPESPRANIKAGHQDLFDDNSSMSSESGRCRRVKTSQPKRNITARDSNGGIANVRMASDGHVAHSGIAKAPTHVQVLGDTGCCLADGGLSVPNHNRVL